MVNLPKKGTVDLPTTRRARAGRTPVAPPGADLPRFTFVDHEDRDSISGTVREGTRNCLQTARHRIKIVSPYFVPNACAAKALGQARRAGIGVELVTHSLASTDEPLVDVGYQHQLKELLEMGVDVREISSGLSVTHRRMGIFGHRLGALHMKNAVVDEAEGFLGSMHFDARSARLNTELGLIIQSPEMAAQLQSVADAGSVYRLRLNPTTRDIEWVERDDTGAERALADAAQTGGGRCLKLWLLSPFEPEGEL
jgi:phosphatidylserine/phosphatidylglycerophosphate/cardiolipin synthase-like enzyme